MTMRLKVLRSQLSYPTVFVVTNVPHVEPRNLRSIAGKHTHELALLLAFLDLPGHPAASLVGESCLGLLRGRQESSRQRTLKTTYCVHGSLDEGRSSVKLTHTVLRSQLAERSHRTGQVVGNKKPPMLEVCDASYFANNCVNEVRLHLSALLAVLDRLLNVLGSKNDTQSHWVEQQSTSFLCGLSDSGKGGGDLPTRFTRWILALQLQDFIVAATVVAILLTSVAVGIILFKDERDGVVFVPFFVVFSFGDEQRSAS
jgi:hypothetical protein